MKKIFIFIIIILLPFNFVFANGFDDTDNDGVPDKDEVGLYMTNPNIADTDGDGYSDFIELNNGYSPHNPEIAKLEDNDYDNDGLSDKMELNFHTDLSKTDTDGDGFSDGDEVNYGYDPTEPGEVKMSKKIEINTGPEQKLYYFYKDVRIGEFLISSGKRAMYTPTGKYKVDGKHLRAWSARWGLWMPYWMSLQNGYFGIHELPEWPNGVKEGEDHLGIAVSHGCIRLGVGPAEFLYNWAEIGTEVYIY